MLKVTLPQNGRRETGEVGATVKTGGPGGRELGSGSKGHIQFLTVSNVLVTLGKSFCLSVSWFPDLKNDLSVPCKVLCDLCAKK